ncbi:hypothetical protein [Bacillus sp. FJAT-27445]|uniref:hypothetical protein n=1 Tax=Bacillus sp. FJAT-27445 TaxID=1679166 RepID=UPI0007435FFA|nr:hypothetical protein [Bacillus sp. FJAT-27445]
MQNEFKKKSIRGGVIADLLFPLETIRDNTTTIINEVQGFGVKDTDNRLLLMKFRVSAYNIFFNYVEYLFKTKKFQNKKFRNKTFKGSKIVKLMSLLRLRIDECEFHEKFFGEYNTNISDLYAEQKKAFQEIWDFLQKYLVENFDEACDFFDSFLGNIFNEEENINE